VELRCLGGDIEGGEQEESANIEREPEATPLNSSVAPISGNPASIHSLDENNSEIHYSQLLGTWATMPTPEASASTNRAGGVPTDVAKSDVIDRSTASSTPRSRFHRYWAYAVIIAVFTIIAIVLAVSLSSNGSSSSTSPSSTEDDKFRNNDEDEMSTFSSISPSTMTPEPTLVSSSSTPTIVASTTDDPTSLVSSTLEPTTISAGPGEFKFTAADGATGHQFGWAVGLSGNTAVISANRDEENGVQSGSVYVFVISGSTWTQEAKLTASDGKGEDQFGFSVAIEGDTVVVGAWNVDTNRGGTYIYVRSGTAWTEQAKLVNSDSSDDNMGESVAISNDTVVVGASVYDSFRGSVYVFVRSGSMWTEQVKLTASDGTQNDYFGVGVAISDDTIVIGAYNRNENGFASGSAYIYSRSGSDWTEQAKLIPSDGDSFDRYGRSVAIDFDTAVIAAENDDDSGRDSGSVYIYIREGSEWTEQAKLVASDGAIGDSFGKSVAASGDLVVIGSSRDDDDGLSSGSAYAYARSGVTWSPKEKFVAPDASRGDYFGRSVALDGGKTVIGAHWDEDKGYRSGSAYFIDIRQ